MGGPALLLNCRTKPALRARNPRKLALRGWGGREGGCGTVRGRRSWKRKPRAKHRFSNHGPKPRILVTRCTCKNADPWVPSQDSAESNAQKVWLSLLSLTGPRVSLGQAEGGALPARRALERHVPPFPMPRESRRVRRCFSKYIFIIGLCTQL